MLKELNVLFMTPKSLPTVVWGDVGIAKTSRIQQLCEYLGVHYETIIASIRDPSDFLGLAFRSDGGSGVDYEAPRWAYNLRDIPNSIAIFDEISNCTPAVQDALLRVVHEKIVGDVRLHPTTKIVALANPPEIAANGWEFSPPMANRFVHLQETAPTMEQWYEFMSGITVGKGDDVWHSSVNEKQWNQNYIKACGLAMGYLKAKPYNIQEDPEKRAARFPSAFATPRTWEQIVRSCATYMCLHGDDLAGFLKLASATVGSGIATDFVQHAKKMDLPDPEIVLSNTKKSYFSKRIDRNYAIAMSVVSIAIMEKEDFSDRWNRAWEVLGKLPNKDIAVICGKKLINNRRDAKISASSAKIFREIVPIALQAGV